MKINNDNNLRESGVHEGFVDLHMHSHNSDGIFSPEEVVRRAKSAGLKAISLTDHDTVDGVAEAIEIGEELGVEVIPGIELSVLRNGNDIHILGYFLDYDNQEMLDCLKIVKAERHKRVIKMVEKLNSLGVNVKLESVLEKAEGESIGRPHVASALLEGGFVETFEDAFRLYIGNDGPAYVRKYKVTAREGIDMIHSAGGLAVIAHPGIYRNDEIVTDIIKEGIDGIEVIHPNHSPKQIKTYEKIVNRFVLVKGGGSDSHGDRDHDTEIGSQDVPYEFLDKMKNRLNGNKPTEYN